MTKEELDALKNKKNLDEFELSALIAELYELPEAFNEVATTLLMYDAGRMFELAVENGIAYDPDNNGASTAYIKVKGYIKHAIDTVHSDHPTKLEATLYAIGLALVKKKETE